MTTLSTYTTPETVRAVLGVSKTELTDATLDLPIWLITVEHNLEAVSEGIVEEFAVVEAVPPASRDVKQKKFYELVQLYAPYSLAKELLVSLPLFSVKSLTDGKAEFQRQDNVFEDVKDGVDAALTSLKYRLLAAYESLTSATPTARPTFSTIVSSPLGTDPVTNA